MVVSVEISGVLEEKLRRLVELGIYASVSEAVRDAVRSMLSNIDLKKIAANLYITRGTSLHYACHFAETPCTAFIDYLLLQGHTPGLGYLNPPPGVDDGSLYILDPSSILVIYSSTLSKIIDRLVNLDIRVPNTIWNYYILLKARALRINSKLERTLTVIEVPEKKPPQSILVTSREYSILNYAGKNRAIIVTDDIYIQKTAGDMGVKFIPSVSLLIYAYKRGLVSPVEYREALMSLDSIPYSYHASLLEVLG